MVDTYNIMLIIIIVLIAIAFLTASIVEWSSKHTDSIIFLVIFIVGCVAVYVALEENNYFHNDSE